MRETWKPVVGAEGRYEVSDLGRVRSVDRCVVVPSRHGGNFIRVFKGRMRKNALDKDGYPRVSLYAQGSRMVLAPVHRLVAQAFLPNPEGLPEVDHRDSDRANARAGNLQWVAEGRNSQLMVERERHARGREHGNARLNEDAVRAIRQRAGAGETYVSLAAGFGVSDIAVRRIALGLAWKHVP